MPGGLSPADAVLWLRGDPRPFALIGEWLGVGAVLGSEPVRVAGRDEDPFELLSLHAGVASGGSPGAAVGGGWVGWLGYRLGARIERLPPDPPAPVPRPPFSLAFYDHVVIYDGKRWWFEALWSPARERALTERLASWRQRLSAPPAPGVLTAPSPFALASNGGEGHVAAVDDCRQRIAAGELYQANLCVRLEARFEGDPLNLFVRALPAAQPRFGALVDGIVSLSPERFLRRTGRHVQTEPVKGTRPRVGPERERQAALSELQASPKDAAEHVMIVDLMRNDLGRVCEYRSIVAEPSRVEAAAGVWHLVSTVSGLLRGQVDDGELLRATFPPGSVTGAPKVQAMKVISQLESTRRELYTGSIGIVSPLAGLDLSVAIRTFELARGRIWLGVGGGIVADSDSEAELEEALTKARGAIAAIGGRLADGPPRRPRGSKLRAAAPAPAPPPAPALRHGTRPDPALGVFETVLVLEGRPIALAEHLARLAGSLDELYSTALEGGLTERVKMAVSTVVRGRLRILAGADGSISITVAEEPAASAEPVPLMPFGLPGGLGAHKWRDRTLLDALGAVAPGTVPLLVDTDGLVLEAAYANVWIIERGRLLTPPADGRILPGLTRAALLASEPGAREQAIDLDRLARAGAIFLSSSIGGRREARLAPIAQYSS